MEKILTISIAAYNVEKYIEKTLNSLIVPEIMDELEVIIVDDGSRDKTAEIAREYVNKYPDTFVLLNKENGGYGSTINASIKVARGKYYKLLDGDDWFEKEGLKKIISYLKKQETDIIFSKYTLCYEDGRQSEIVEEYDIYDKVFSVSEIDRFAMHAICVKTSILKKPLLHINEHCFYTDYEFCVKAISRSQTVIAVPINVYCYRLGREGQSVSASSIIKHIDNHELVTKTIIDLVYRNNDMPGLKKKANELARYHIGYLILPMANNENKEKFLNFLEWLKKQHPYVGDFFKGYIKLLYKYPKLTYYPFSKIKRGIYKLKGKL